jgi:hypothetical protein
VRRLAAGRHGSRRVRSTLLQSKLALTVWFWAAYLTAAHSIGILPLQLQRRLSFGPYKTALLRGSKLRRTMLGPGHAPLAGFVEVDDTEIPYPLLPSAASLASAPQSNRLRVRCRSGRKQGDKRHRRKFGNAERISCEKVLHDLPRPPRPLRCLVGKTKIFREFPVIRVDPKIPRPTQTNARLPRPP